jgi:hypothetical protein
MNAKQVLSKIASMLNLSDETPIQAKTKDGTILQSSNFDVNDDVVEVGTDGKTTPVADGEYTISFTSPEGVESTVVLDVKDGKIEEISTPNEEAEETEGTPEEKAEEMEGETTDQTSTVGGDLNMAKDYVKAPKGLETDTAKSLPNTTDEDPRNRVGPDTDDKKDPIISLSYRISELEKMIAECKLSIGDLTDKKLIAHPEAQTTSTESDIKLAEEEEVDVPKLDGAPVEMDKVNLSALHKPNNSKQGNYQGSFLSKLYK